MLMMIPEAWENHASMDPAKRAFYQFHSTLMEPWDGPASVAFTDGTVIGAVLDRNGLRPSRVWVTSDGLVVMASEVGVLDIDPSTIVRKMRLQPGRMFLVDTAEGRIVGDEELKSTLAAEHPYEEWLHGGLLQLSDLPERAHTRYPHSSVLRRQLTFGYTTEELKVILAPMARTGAENLGSMGTDTPIAVLSTRPRLLFDYFSQLFAQVTNPPLDAIREELVTSIGRAIGPERNLLDPGAASCRQVVLPGPVLDNDELARLVHANDDGDLPGFQGTIIKGLFKVADGGEGLRVALADVRAQASDAIAQGARVIVLSDRDSNAELAPIPTLLLTSAIHHHLVREKTRTQVGLVVEAGDAREVHHLALLIGYGAAAVNPYMAFETIEDMIVRGQLVDVGGDDAVHHYIKAGSKGILKVMSKMGISTVASYCGAQVFEAIGLSQSLVDRYFTWTSTRIGGIGLDEIAAEVAACATTWPTPSGRGAGPPRARGGRRVPVAPGGRVPPLQPRDGVQAAARRLFRRLQGLQGVHQAGGRPGRAPGHVAGPVPVQDRRAAVDPDRRGRAGQRDRQALLHRGHELRLDLGRGPREPGHRHEQARRQVQHR